MNADKKPLVTTVLLSLIGGFLAGLWATRIDPDGTGGSILMLPVIFILFLVCGSLFVTGIISLKNSFGGYLIGASFLIPISFYVSKELFLLGMN